ncbi:MAG TPA: LssY C-terminal domain-containing protein [Paludibaculum sp.]|jgi:hypothetical protein
MPRLLASLLLIALPLFAQSKAIEIPGNRSWVDTGIDVKPGDLLRYVSTGSLKYADAQQAAAPEGIPRGWKDLIRILPLNDAGRGAVIGRIGAGDAARAFLIGTRRESRALAAGRLFIGINQPAGSSGEGAFQVKVEIVARAGDDENSFTGTLPPITDAELAQIPRRVVDKDNNPGDRVNFLILGTEEQVKQALLAVGWVVVDRSVKDTILRGALGTFSKQAYLTMPMSELMVFGRAQDYGFAMSDPIQTVMARHHFRIWKAPFTAGGLTLWVGAGTHDIGFDKDQRTGGITHKIDPETDKEREFIAESLSQSGQVIKTAYVTPKDTITKGITAHGEEFFSDGRILVIYLKPESGNAAVPFSDYFCSVLKQNNPDGEDSGACAQWMETPGKTDLALAAPSTQYRVLVVPGIMNTCVADTPAFEKGRKVLTEKYGLTTELLSVPNDSSESNAKVIADFIRKSPEDQRKFIIVGYSKGTPDIQTALALDPTLKDSIAAFISVSGASGGSPIADSLPMQLDAYLAKAKQGKCEGNLAEGFKSLKKETRQRFLSSYPHPAVPTYSLASLTTAERVPSMAKQTYLMLSAYDRQNDGQLLKMDQIIPESNYLGAVWSDHLGVALAMNSKFPRAALFESLIRFVLDDLNKGPKPAAKSAAKPPAKAVGWGQ